MSPQMSAHAGGPEQLATFLEGGGVVSLRWTALAALLLCPAGLAQGPVPLRKIVVELNGGIQQPQGPMRAWRGTDGAALFRSQSGWFGFGLGIRAARYLQFDVGFEGGPSVIAPGSPQGAVSNQEKIEDRIPDGGPLFVPFGVRIVLPLASERVIIGLGGGGSFLTSADANVDAEIGGQKLKVCASGPCVSRRGFGGYALARMEYLVGRERRVGIGIVGRFTRAKLHGSFLPVFNGSRDHDQWLQLGGTVSIRF